MKTISLFSTKRSVLNYWEKHIYKKYNIFFYSDLSKLYNELEDVKPDIILFDYSRDVSIAEELLEYMKDNNLKTYIMILNSCPIFSEGVKLIRKGARAFMNAYARPENLNNAIEVVFGNNIWLYTEFIHAMIKQSLFSHVDESYLMKILSSRKREIAQMVALGMSNKEIAKHSDITEQTVKTHLKSIYEKLNVHTRLELAIMINQIKNSYERGIDGNG